MSIASYQAEGFFEDDRSYDWPEVIEALRRHLARAGKRKGLIASRRNKRSEITYDTLAHMIGCSERTLRNYVKGRTEPGGAVLRILIDHVNQMDRHQQQAAAEHEAMPVARREASA